MIIAHKVIKKFELEGEIYDEAGIPRIKEQHIFMIKMMMKAKGYLIRYDIDPDFTIAYNGKSFDFKLSIYGVFVGKKKAQWFDGVDHNRLVSNSTQKSKSEEHSWPAA